MPVSGVTGTEVVPPRRTCRSLVDCMCWARQSRWFMTMISRSRDLSGDVEGGRRYGLRGGVISGCMLTGPSGPCKIPTKAGRDPPSIGMLRFSPICAGSWERDTLFFAQNRSFQPQMCSSRFAVMMCVAWCEDRCSEEGRMALG